MRSWAGTAKTISKNRQLRDMAAGLQIIFQKPVDVSGGNHHNLASFETRTKRYAVQITGNSGGDQ
jgi:hypothetical protein